MVFELTFAHTNLSFTMRSYSDKLLPSQTFLGDRISVLKELSEEILFAVIDESVSLTEQV